jgi:hypothetical protein
VLFGYGLWINLWITGVKSVDNPVEDFVDNMGLWITRGLSTFLPQENASCPHFCPQHDGLVYGLDTRNLDFIHTVHRPYYYYYSKNLKV